MYMLTSLPSLYKRQAELPRPPFIPILLSLSCHGLQLEPVYSYLPLL